ncbi:hypothetical protein [Haloferula sp.]|uniref:hypothetical protein n=1 Tax=Haloferula sp. TaxID=2497595 RepID=UPI003C7384D8
MKRSRKQSDPERLERLADQAQDYALHMLRTTGSVPSTVIADTDDGYIFCMPTELVDDEAKDRFAEVARLFAVACRARALVMVVESWVSLPDASGHLDTSVAPSESPDRREMVAVLLEDAIHAATRLIPIIRHDAGGFAGLGDSGALEYGEGEGRFSQLMPKHRPASSDVEMARRQLELLGMRIENRGFDPSMN